jgi:hypothetical protein
MVAEIDIQYDQLVKLVKQLPKKQWSMLKDEIEAQSIKTKAKGDMLSFLLSAPTFSQNQIDEIAKARKEIEKWRTK